MTGVRVYAIVVTFQPDLPRFKQLLTACLPQVAHLVVVDNGSDDQVLASVQTWAGHDGFSVIGIGENVGVAAAQNRGVIWARAQGCSHVLMLDQDSIPSSGMVQKLLAALDETRASGVPVAATGPRLIDRRTGASTPFVRIGLLGVTRHEYRDENSSLIPTDFLISSGMLIPLEILDRVGLPEEDLFIDNVDLEWCFRARSMGLSLYGVYDAVMEHSVGDHVVQLGSYVIHLHAPLRQYYIMRNRIVLYQRSYSPWGWIIQDFVRMLFKLMAFSLFFPPRRQNIAMMLKGIKDGLTGKMGKFR